MLNSQNGINHSRSLFPLSITSNSSIENRNMKSRTKTSTIQQRRCKGNEPNTKKILITTTIMLIVSLESHLASGFSLLKSTHLNKFCSYGARSTFYIRPFSDSETHNNGLLRSGDFQKYTTYKRKKYIYPIRCFANNLYDSGTNGDSIFSKYNYDRKASTLLTAFIGRIPSRSSVILNSKSLDGDDDDEEEDDYYYDEDDDMYEDDEDAEEDAQDKEWVAEEAKIRTFLQELDEATEEIKSLDIDEIVDNLSPEDIENIDSDDIENLADGQVKKFTLSEEDIDISKMTEENKAIIAEKDDNEDEIFPPDGDWMYGPNATLKQKDFIQYEEVLKKLEQAQEELNSGSTEINNIGLIDDEYIMTNVLDEETRNEILNLDDEVPLDEDGEPDEIELHRQRKQLIYDLDFNITNVFLASFKVNPDAPVILEHWMFEMRNWTRYDYVRESGFNFTWDDVDNADTEELDKYWKGTGTDGTPKPSPRENPNIIEWDESTLTFEEENLLALETWMDEVYQDDDDINLDDEDLMPEDNPAAPEHGLLSEDVLPPELKDVEEFEEKYSHMSQEWRDEYVTKTEYKVVNKIDSDFRGHLVIACSSTEEDLEMSEKLTMRMDKEFGEQVFVETRVVGHAKPEDHLYEIWLESWEIELLHSKRRAVFQKDWEGPRDITEDYIDDLVNKIDFYISDDFRHSFLLGDDGK